MTELVLQASDDLVARLAHEGEPTRAIVELVWNAIDAEAGTVKVELERTDTEGICQVRVVDDGHGITSDEVEATFGRIGGSWKKLMQKSKNGKRPLHGSRGEGRLRAFALGSRVTWASHSDNTAGVRQSVTIRGDRSNRHVFSWDARSSNEPDTGTTVTAYNDEQRSLAALDSDGTLAVLRSHFAPVLLNETDLVIEYDLTPLTPREEVLHDTTIEVPFEAESGSFACTLRVIEWRTGKHRAIYFSTDGTHFVYEEAGTDVEGQFPFSAYVTWDGLDQDAVALLGLGDMAPEPVGDLWKAAREAIREHFVARRRERRREQVKDWQDEGIYPYKGKPKTESEKAERAVFDVVSGTLVPHISKKRNDARLTLALLRDALRHDPDKLTTIIHEVVALSDTDRDTLTNLLSETSLSAIIRSSNLITSRHKFLTGLQHLLFDPLDSPTVGERDHLHKIIEHELWIFGEEYHLMNSERSLTELVRTHLRLEGLPTKDVETVRRWDSKTGRVDLHLAAAYRQHDRVRHLVVELKAPDIKAGRRELDQVEDYANAVHATAAFSGNAEWDFILATTDFDEVVQNRIFRNSKTGQFFESTNKPGRPLVRAYVRRWSDLIDENKRRLEFATSALEHDPSIAEGLAHVKKQYQDLLPDLPEID